MVFFRYIILNYLHRDGGGDDSDDDDDNNNNNNNNSGSSSNNKTAQYTPACLCRINPIQACNGSFCSIHIAFRLGLHRHSVAITQFSSSELAQPP